MGKQENPSKTEGETGDLFSLSEEDRRALRGSKFAPLPSVPLLHRQEQRQPRLAHPGGPLTTNKAAALAKFLERKLQQPGGLDSINPELLERAVENAKEAVNAGGASGRIIRHVASFEDSAEESEEYNGNTRDTVGGSKIKKKNITIEAAFSKKGKSKKKKKKKKKAGESSSNHAKVKKRKKSSR